MVIDKFGNISEKSFTLKFPVILKLLTEDASIGISEYSVVKNFKDLKDHVEFFSQYIQAGYNCRRIYRWKRAKCSDTGK